MLAAVVIHGEGWNGRPKLPELGLEGFDRLVNDLAVGLKIAPVRFLYPFPPKPLLEFLGGFPFRIAELFPDIGERCLKEAERVAEARDVRPAFDAELDKLTPHHDRTTIFEVVAENRGVIETAPVMRPENAPSVFSAKKPPSHFHTVVKPPKTPLVVTATNRKGASILPRI